VSAPPTQGYFVEHGWQSYHVVWCEGQSSETVGTICDKGAAEAAAAYLRAKADGA
jgi:hypothetical protein